MNAILAGGTRLVVMLAALSTAPVVLAEDESPYLIEQKVFNKQVKKVAVAPAEAFQRVGIPDNVARLIEQEVTRLLERKGYELIPVAVYAEIRDRMTRQVGGLTDPQTGELDKDRVAAVREHSFREMLFRHDMDAVVRIRVQHVGAPFENDRAEWDNVKQDLEVRKEERGSPYRGKKLSGTIAASSVQVRVYDRAEDLLYSDAGGIELVMRRAGPGFEDLPASQLFQDEKQIKKAVKLAVNEL